MDKLAKQKISKPLLAVFWIAIVLLSANFYFDNAIVYFFGYRNPRFDANKLWFVLHIAGATCSLFLGPIQFWKSIRTKYIRFHRIAGKIYIIGSLIAAAGAFRLALTFDCVGCRYSLIPLSILFFLTTSLAWYAILQKILRLINSSWSEAMFVHLPLCLYDYIRCYRLISFFSQLLMIMFLPWWLNGRFQFCH